VFCDNIPLWGIELLYKRFFRRAHRLAFIGIFKQSKYKAMKIVLNKANPSAVLVIGALNAAGVLLPAIDVDTQKPTITPGSVGVKFDTDVPGVDVVQASDNELQVTLTKNITTGLSLFAVATGLNENGEIVKSDPLEIVIEADAIDGIAASLVWQFQTTQPTAAQVAAVESRAAVVRH